MPRVHGDAVCRLRGWDVGHGHGRSSIYSLRRPWWLWALRGGSEALSLVIARRVFRRICACGNICGLFLPVVQQRRAVVSAVASSL